jgi:hypothetical protein
LTRTVLVCALSTIFIALHIWKISAIYDWLAHLAFERINTDNPKVVLWGAVIPQDLIGISLVEEAAHFAVAQGFVTAGIEFFEPAALIVLLPVTIANVLYMRRWATKRLESGAILKRSQHDGALYGCYLTLSIIVIVIEYSYGSGS